MLGFLTVAGSQHEARTTGRPAGAGQTSFGVCMQSGRVLFEHPWTATSWNQPCLRKLLANDGMRRVRCDQCQFGMTSVDDEGNVGPARKATGFMTNDEYIVEAVDRRCFGGHDHNPAVERQSEGL